MGPCAEAVYIECSCNSFGGVTGAYRAEAGAVRPSMLRQTAETIGLASAPLAMPFRICDHIETVD